MPRVVGLYWTVSRDYTLQKNIKKTGVILHPFRPQITATHHGGHFPAFVESKIRLYSVFQSPFCPFYPSFHFLVSHPFKILKMLVFQTVPLYLSTKTIRQLVRIRHQYTRLHLICFLTFLSPILFIGLSLTADTLKGSD